MPPFKEKEHTKKHIDFDKSIYKAQKAIEGASQVLAKGREHN